MTSQSNSVVSKFMHGPTLVPRPHPASPLPPPGHRSCTCLQKCPSYIVHEFCHAYMPLSSILILYYQRYINCKQLGHYIPPSLISSHFFNTATKQNKQAFSYRLSAMRVRKLAVLYVISCPDPTREERVW